MFFCKNKTESAEKTSFLSTSVRDFNEDCMQQRICIFIFKNEHLD